MLTIEYNELQLQTEQSILSLWRGLSCRNMLLLHVQAHASRELTVLALQEAPSPEKRGKGKTPG